MTMSDSADGRFRPDQSSIALLQRVRAPRPRIWAALSQPQGLAAWQADEAAGELRVGGAITLGWPALGLSVMLDVVRVEPEQRLILRNGQALVDTVIGDQLVTLTHSGLAHGDDHAGLESSWRVALALLAHHCERPADEQRRVHWLIGATRCSAAAAHVFFTDSAALASWLTRRGQIGETGSELALELADGTPLSGHVLANVPGHDLAVSWQEDGQSVLCMRTLPVSADPGQRLVALCWSRWGDAPMPEPRLEALEAAHVRLLRALDRRTWV
jgi:uncharacterized protein YndB with AHSA1/START domain